MPTTRPPWPLPRLLSGVNPLWLTGLFIVVGLAVPAVFIIFPGLGAHIPHAVSLAILALVALPLLFTVGNVIQSHQQARGVFHLAFLYVQIVVVFGMAHCYVVSATRSRELHARPDHRVPPAAVPASPAIAGIEARWVDLLADPQRPDRAIIFAAYLGVLHDCLHFSLVTSATVGYGDMAPATRLARILVDLQIAMTIFFVTFGVGSFFVRAERQLGPD